MQCRIEDLAVGDIINRDPDGLRGWFEIAHISTLFNGEVQLADESQNESVSGGPFDVVGVQLIEEFALDDETGFVLPPEPLQITAPIQAAPVAVDPPDPVPVVPVAVDPVPVEPVAADPVIADPPSVVPVAPAAAEPVAVQPVSEPAAVDPVIAEPVAATAAQPTPTPTPEPEPVSANDDLEAALAVPAPVALDFRSGAEVDLAMVAAALDGLDVGTETYEVTYEPAPTPVEASAAEPVPTQAHPTDGAPSGSTPTEGPASDPSTGARRSTDPSSVTWARRSPDLPPVPMPEGAVPVYGDTLPDSPSYLNPVVVREPGAAPLPKRRGS